MNPEKLEECMLLILKSIPKGNNVTGIKLIQSYEELDRELSKSNTYLFEIAEALIAHNYDEGKLVEVDQYFKAVHKAIRSKIKKKSSLLTNVLESVLMNNFKTSRGPMFTKEEGLQALEAVFDYYDPNVRQDFAQQSDNWAGFWSLVETENGSVNLLKLVDTSDREIFYEELEKNQGLHEPETLILGLWDMREAYLADLDKLSFTDETNLKPEHRNAKSYQEMITKHYLEFASTKIRKEVKAEAPDVVEKAPAIAPTTKTKEKKKAVKGVFYN